MYLDAYTVSELPLWVKEGAEYIVVSEEDSEGDIYYSFNKQLPESVAGAVVGASGSTSYDVQLNQNLVPDTVELVSTVDGSQETLTDDGDGNIGGGTVDYTTGAITGASFSGATEDDVTANYDHERFDRIDNVQDFIEEYSESKIAIVYTDRLSETVNF